VLIFTAAVEGAKQKTQLLDSLKNLFTRRILTKMTVMQAAVPRDWISQVSAMVTVLQYTTDPTAAQTAVGLLQKQVMADMQTEKSRATFENAYQLLKALDVQKGAYQKYDPSLADAKAYSATLQTGNTTATPSAAVMPDTKSQAAENFFPITHPIRTQMAFSISGITSSVTGAVSSAANSAVSSVTGAASDTAVFSKSTFGHLIDAVPLPTLDQLKSGDIIWPGNSC
jgi:hypothetical protein